MDNVLLLSTPFVVAAGTAALCYVLLRARMEVAIVREREAHARTRSALSSIEDTLEDKLRLAHETAHRKAMDQFLTGFRVEERRYLRDRSERPAVVLQERLLFRNM